MNERVMPTGRSDVDVVISYQKDGYTLGIGLEPTKGRPAKGMIDQIFGDAHIQTAIGRNLSDRILQEKATFGNVFETKDTEAEFYNRLGRYALDAVTGSVVGDGWWTWLDRAGVNRLIRLLRKGRDLSFGRDE